MPFQMCNLPTTSGGDSFRLLANCFLFLFRDSAVFIFPTLLAYFKDPIQNQDKVPALWVELHISHSPLFFYFNIILFIFYFILWRKLWYTICGSVDTPKILWLSEIIIIESCLLGIQGEDKWRAGGKIFTPISRF